MADNKMKEQEKEEVLEDPESLPIGEAPGDGKKKGKKKKEEPKQLKALPTAETPGLFELPPNTKLKMTAEEWAKHVQEVLDRGATSKQRLLNTLQHIEDEVIATTKSLTGLDAVHPNDLTEENIEDLEDGSYDTNDDDDDDDDTESEYGEGSEGESEDLDETKGSDELIIPATSSGEITENADDAEGSDVEMKDADDLDYVPDGHGDPNGSDEQSEGSASENDCADMKKAMALQEGTIMDIDEDYEDDIQDMDD